jgi:paraquat-inducible protein A
MKSEMTPVDSVTRFHDDPDSLVVCPGCDMIHARVDIKAGEAGACQRCELEFVFPPAQQFDHTIALSITSLFLMVGAVYFPFLSLSRSGLSREASLIQIAQSFQDGWFVLVGLFFVMFVIIFPIFRALSLIYALWPLSRGAPPYKYARFVYRISEKLNPWGMAEIFFVGTGVALVKITKLVKIEFEFSFWIFALLVLSLVAMNFTLHRKDVWDRLDNGAA